MAGGRRQGTGSRRLSRAWASIAAVVVGTLALAGFGWWLQQSRETDFQIGTAAVSNKAVLDIPANAPSIRFTDVAAGVGITMTHGPGPRTHALPEDTGSGLAWGDYDADGDLDLYVVNLAPVTERDPADVNAGAANRLFRNDGGQFVDVAAAAGVADPEGFGMGASFVDDDGDGDLDLYVTNFGPNRLFRNQGDGTFQDMAAQVGVADPGWSTGAAWGDYDRDGDLDLYVANYVQWSRDMLGSTEDLDTEFPYTLNPNAFSAEPDSLYRNRGDGSYEDVAQVAGVADAEGRGLNAVFCDLDDDGWLDLYVTNDASANRLYLNRGANADGHLGFDDQSAATGMADPRSGMGITITDLAGESGPDGWPDIFVTNWVAQDNALFRGMVEGGVFTEFHDVARAFGLAEVSTERVGWGSTAADLDLDGRPDLTVANGSTLQQPKQPVLLQPQTMFLFWNDGDRFYDVAPAAGDALTQAYDGRGLAAADYDADGDVDLAVSVNRGAPLLLRNDTETANRGLAVVLNAPEALRYGARIQVTVGGVTQTRWFGGDASYLSMHAADLPFGLGGATMAERVAVTWADGRQTELTDVPAGRVDLTLP